MIDSTTEHANDNRVQLAVLFILGAFIFTLFVLVVSINIPQSLVSALLATFTTAVAILALFGDTSEEIDAGEDASEELETGRRATFKRLTLIGKLTLSLTVVIGVVSLVHVAKVYSSEKVTAERNSWIIERNNVRLSRSLLKMLSPFDSMRPASCSISDLASYLDDKFVTKCCSANLEYTLGDIAQHTNFDPAVVGSVDFSMPAWQIIQQKINESNDEMNDSIALCEGLLDPKDMAAIDAIRFSQFIVIVESWDKDSNKSIVASDLKVFFEACHALAERIHIESKIYKGLF